MSAKLYHLESERRAAAALDLYHEAEQLAARIWRMYYATPNGANNKRLRKLAERAYKRKIRRRRAMETRT